MNKDIPIVCKAILDDPSTTGPRIQLDTPQWFAWLEQSNNLRFSYALYNDQQGYIDGFMTVRKEKRQRGRFYWSVYRRQQKRLRKIYLGPSDVLTLNKLEEVANMLRDSPTT